MNDKPKVNIKLKTKIGAGIIVLLLILAVAPSINGKTERVKTINKTKSNSNLCSKTNKLVTLTVTEYKPDGGIEKRTINLSYDRFIEMREKINNAHEKNERLSVFKQYNLIPQDITTEKLRLGMKKKAEQIGLTMEKIEDIANTIQSRRQNLNGFSVVMNALCQVEGSAWIGRRFYGGFSWFTSFINGIIFWYSLEFNKTMPPIPSVDLVDFGLAMGEMHTKNGLFPNNGEGGFFMMAYLMAGFVGYVVEFLPIPIVRNAFGGEVFIGFAALAFSAGPSPPVPYQFWENIDYPSPSRSVGLC